MTLRQTHLKGPNDEKLLLSAFHARRDRDRLDRRDHDFADFAMNGADRKPAIHCLRRLICGLFDKDLSFPFVRALLAIGSALALLGSTGDAERDRLTGGAAIASIALLFTLLAVVSARFDRRTLEDCVHRLMAHGAIIAVATTLFTFPIFDPFDNGLLPLAGSEVMFVMLLIWGFGFLFYRLKGRVI